jgi:hypothetical protein
VTEITLSEIVESKKASKELIDAAKKQLIFRKEKSTTQAIETMSIVRPTDQELSNSLRKSIKNIEDKYSEFNNKTNESLKEIVLNGEPIEARLAKFVLQNRGKNKKTVTTRNNVTIGTIVIEE